MTIKAIVANNNAEFPNNTNIIDVEKPTVSDSQILIKSVAFAVNQIDYSLLKNAIHKDGTIVGFDVGGVVEEVGRKVIHIKCGDYVSAFIGGDWAGFRGGFSEYVAAEEVCVIRYDKFIFKMDPVNPGSYPSGPINTFEGAASTTFSLATMAVSFSHNFGFNADKNYCNDLILIWGGATTVGSIAIQLAKKIYGFKVVAIASLYNKDFLFRLGADVVLDYHDKNIIQEIKEVGEIKYGLDAVGSISSFQGVYDATAPHAIIDNIFLIPSTQIKLDSTRDVEFKTTFIHLTLGDSKGLDGKIIKSSPELMKNYRTFWLDVLPKYINQLRTTNLRVLEPGFLSVLKSMILFDKDKVRAEKIVFRFQ